MVKRYFSSVGEHPQGDYVKFADYDAAEARIRELEAELAAEKENSARGWELFERFRKKYAELRFPGMTAEVKAKS